MLNVLPHYLTPQLKLGEAEEKQVEAGIGAFIHVRIFASNGITLLLDAPSENNSQFLGKNNGITHERNPFSEVGNGTISYNQFDDTFNYDVSFN